MLHKRSACFVILALIITVFAAVQVFAAEHFDPLKVYGPCIDKLCLVIITNPDAQVLAAEKGDLDIISDITRPSDVDRLSRNPALSMSLARGFHAFFMLLNNKVSPWNDKTIRQAAALADRVCVVHHGRVHLESIPAARQRLAGTGSASGGRRHG